MNQLDSKWAGKRLVVIGAGDLAREVKAWFPDVPISGYLGTLSPGVDQSELGPLLGDPDHYIPKPDEVYLCAISSTRTRLAFDARFSLARAQFITLIHPTALIAPQTYIGEGSIIFPGAILDHNSRIGNHTVLYFRAGVGHDSVVGDGCNVLTNGVIGAHCIVEKGCTVSTLGFCNSGIRMGAFSVVGANSFAARDVPACAAAIGVPARNVSSSGQKLSAKTLSTNQIEEIDSAVC